jgi:hypothetical protein
MKKSLISAGQQFYPISKKEKNSGDQIIEE